MVAVVDGLVVALVDGDDVAVDVLDAVPEEVAVVVAVVDRVVLGEDVMDDVPVDVGVVVPVLD